MKTTLLAIALLALTACAHKKEEPKVEAKTENTTQAAPSCICEKIFMPVCGADGQTYGNACEAKCNGQTKYTKGSCNSKKTTTKKK